MSICHCVCLVGLTIDTAGCVQAAIRTLRNSLQDSRVRLDLGNGIDFSIEFDSRVQSLSVTHSYPSDSVATITRTRMSIAQALKELYF